MPPPAEPIYPGSRKEWSAFQKKVGLRFPEEYFTLANTYGSGRFLSGEVKIANPFDPDNQSFADRELKTLRETKEIAPAEVPYALFPEAGGLYPFGINGNGHTFLWLTEGGPDEWPILWYTPANYSKVVHHSLSEVLVLMASNKLKISYRHVGTFEPSGEAEFVPRQLRRKPKSKKR